MSIDPVVALPRRRSKSKTATIKHRVIRTAPTARAGFDAGRARGRQFAEVDAVYAVGAVAGFATGVAEAAWDGLVASTEWLFGDAEPEVEPA